MSFPDLAAIVIFGVLIGVPLLFLHLARSKP